jgi:hypothetical protein
MASPLLGSDKNDTCALSSKRKRVADLACSVRALHRMTEADERIPEAAEVGVVSFSFCSLAGAKVRDSVGSPVRLGEGVPRA